MAVQPTLPFELIYCIVSIYVGQVVDKLLVTSPKSGPAPSDTTRTVNAVSRIMDFIFSQKQPGQSMVELGADIAMLSLLAATRQLRAVTLRILSKSLDVRVSRRRFPLISRPLAATLISCQEWALDSHNKFPETRHQRSHVLSAYFFYNTSQHHLAFVIERAQTAQRICAALLKTLASDSSVSVWEQLAHILPDFLATFVTIVDKWETSRVMLNKMSSEARQSPSGFAEKIFEREAEGRTETTIVHAVGLVGVQVYFAIVCARFCVDAGEEILLIIGDVSLKTYLEHTLVPELQTALGSMESLLGGPSLEVLQKNSANKFCSNQNLKNLVDALSQFSSMGIDVSTLDFGECPVIAGKLESQLREFMDKLPCVEDQLSVS
ncbi:hypothetical protein PHLGIDRAFT_125244 [Phlebiopsis gigantea 11061_1 CR5-6]|uniref:Uncharacterized protein n=1 Tax=Phlebiopsis gigantea (strain 11061_1 CR5-6) TaxID=745531 RepID=A0A0C3NZQ3_PHLG1|nr:hypothetical protein PHLGIDRAFT_125244 [Phlebiopsis gigantea 11061_1 CR5-6]